MKRNRKQGARQTIRAALVLAIIAGASFANTTYNESSMNSANWTPTVLESGAGGWSVTVHYDTGGNPDDFRRVVMMTAAAPTQADVSAVTTVHLLNGASYNPRTQGAITAVNYHEDALLYSGSTDSQFTGPMVRQNGQYYIALGLTIPSSPTWQTLTATGMTAASFVWVDVSDPAGGLNTSAHPDFSANGPTLEFGFFRRLATGVGGAAKTSDAAIDNYSITLVTPACTGDMNSDGIVNTSDLVQLLLRFGQSVPPGSLADLNGDGTVNTSDLVQLLVRFGQAC